LPPTASDRENPGAALFGKAFVLTFANSLLDKVVTPEGFTALIEDARKSKRGKSTLGAAPPVLTAKRSLGDNVKFAFFVSPFQFRLDLNASDQNLPGGGVRGSDGTTTLMLMFNGSGWVVSDLRLPETKFAPKIAQAPNQ